MAWETFLGQPNVLYLDLSGAHMAVYICKILLNYTLKISVLYFMQVLYFKNAQNGFTKYLRESPASKTDQETVSPLMAGIFVPSTWNNCWHMMGPGCIVVN